ncbi:hypothetical protein BPT24_024 [Tenacibaculum phage pT24]|uniref:Uncharacterized protein n=1 Tax=Tenacibaculum phage pT24 TaxID=1880590 RepID=A0A1B4XWG0_9CAUD|nr:hypothetical protein HYP10_gp024 [Tenacibaculum phage pT24]BAV39146.1 hypothetical protein BPT24_024 [Tenacibaculum phage pT24]
MQRIQKYSDIFKHENYEVDLQDALKFLIHLDNNTGDFPLTYQKNNVTVGISKNLKPKLMFLYEDVEDSSKNVMCYCIDGLNWKVECDNFVSNYNLNELEYFVEVLSVANNLSQPFKVDEKTGAFKEILRNYKTIDLKKYANKYLKLLIEIKNRLSINNQKLNLHDTLKEFTKFDLSEKAYLTDLNYIDTSSLDCYIELLIMFRTVSKICELNKEQIKNLKTNE